MTSPHGSTRSVSRSDWDFVLHLPLRYEDETVVMPIDQLQEGLEAQVEAVVTAAGIVFRGRRQLRVTVQDEHRSTLVLRFLHFYPSQAKQLAVGQRVRAFGVARGGLAGHGDGASAGSYGPAGRAAARGANAYLSVDGRRPASPGCASGSRARWRRSSRPMCCMRCCATNGTFRCFRQRCVGCISRHRTRTRGRSPSAPIAAWQRLKFDELVAQQIALRQARAARQRHRAPALHADGLAARLLAGLPFRLTRAQQRVWREVEADLAREHPMQRLVQGDVGSGKTVIAALAAARAIESGWQAALMAPTELLAEQHFGRIAEWLTPLGVRTTWLAGRLGAAAKRAAQQLVSSGTAQLAIGTHALIQDAVNYDRLGLAIVDEQHRFGVAQRLALRGSDRALLPHMLMLSATPIPRTLAMSFLADLDVSVIDQLPPGRRPVVTKLVAVRRRDEVLARIRRDVAAGRQAYWVCPLVEESAAVEAAAATETHERIARMLPELRIGLLHGQLPGAEKTAVMQQFASRSIDVLVTTTVIEVGVDVPNATLMVIEHAERFGLAQLHQLRGRIGRGVQQSYCILLYDEPLSETARERLKVVYETNDGFEVARRDLMMRGPGEFLGSRQSGVPLLRLADLERDAELVERARGAAEALLAHDPAAAQEHVRRWYEGRHDFLAA